MNFSYAKKVEQEREPLDEKAKEMISKIARLQQLEGLSQGLL